MASESGRPHRQDLKHISGLFESRVKNKYNRKRHTDANISSQVRIKNYFFTTFNIKRGM